MRIDFRGSSNRCYPQKASIHAGCGCFAGPTKDLIAQIEAGDENDPKWQAKVTVLGEYIDHHVKEERGDIFTKARAAKKLDLVRMRDELQARKEDLREQPAGEPIRSP